MLSQRLPVTTNNCVLFTRATSQAPKRQARRGSQLVLNGLVKFLFQNRAKGP